MAEPHKNKNRFSARREPQRIPSKKTQTTEKKTAEVKRPLEYKKPAPKRVLVEDKRPAAEKKPATNKKPVAQHNTNTRLNNKQKLSTKEGHARKIVSESTNLSKVPDFNWKKISIVLAVVAIALFIALLSINNSNAVLKAENAEQAEKISQLEGIIGDRNNMQASQTTTALPNVDVSADDIKAIPNSSAVQSFGINKADDGKKTVDANTGVAPTIKTDNLLNINKYLGQLQNNGYNTGFLLMDLKTGQGISYNLDYVQYSASTIKGPYCTALCQRLIDTGQVSLDKAITVYDDNDSACGTDSVGSAITAAICQSSNGAYHGLRQAFLSSVDFGTWLSEAGISDTGRFTQVGNDYAYYSPREGALCWLKIYSYLLSGAANASFMQENFGNTEFSYIRNACSKNANLSQATVWNKAGWLIYKDQYNTSSDFGIVRLDDKDYLCIFASDIASDEGNIDSDYVNLIYSVLEARGDFK